MGSAGSLFAACVVAFAARAGETPPPSAASTPADATAKLESLRAELEQSRAERDAVLNWVLENLSGRVPVPEMLISYMDIPVMDEAGKTHPHLVALLRLTPEEAAMLDVALADALEACKMVWARIATPGRTFSGAVYATVPPHEEEGAEIRRRLEDAVRDVLGGGRAQLFWQAATRDLNRRFVFFGAGLRVIRFTPVVFAAADGTETRGIRIHDELVTADESGVRHIEAVEFEAAEIPAEYEFYQRLAGEKRGDEIQAP